MRNHISFGLRSFLSGALSELNTRVDVLMLGFFVSDGIVGIYSLAAIFAEGFNQLPHIVRNNLDPLLGRRFADGDLSRVEEYARKIRRFFWPAMALAGLVAIAVYSWLLRIFFGASEFAASGSVFAILILGVVLSSGYRPFVGILLQGGRPATYTLLVTVIVTVNLLGNIALIPHLGMNGAAIATSAALACEAALIMLLSRRLFAIKL
jgi:O-antigen/teichoic acid export membrane protein